MTAANFPWDDSRLVAPATIHHLSIGGRSVLFCEARQVLYGLNSTADRIWLSLSGGGLPFEARRELADLGLGADEARTFVEDATLSWLEGGQLAPQEALACLSRAASTTRNYQIDELSVRMDFFGGVPLEDVDAVFSQFAVDARPAALRLSIVACRNRLFLFEADRPLGACSADEWIPRLKAALTEHYAARVRNAFLVHAAFLVRDDQGILISGAPGAGKTTLCVALARSGFEYHGDDIVRLESNGKAVGTPFAACVKSAAWPLVEPYVPEIATLPVYRRADEKDVRYLQMPPAKRHPRSIDFVLLLSRQEGAVPAFVPLEPLDAFSVLLESAFSSKGSITAPALKTFATAIDSAASFRFIYSSLPDAIKAVEDLTSE
jgi:hypothetical protein